MLTPAMREYLGRREVGLFYDFVLTFMRHFDVSAVNAGQLIAQWIEETL